MFELIALTCRVVRGKQADALVVTEGRCEQHWGHGRGIQSGLNLLRGAVVKQSCNTHGFPCAQRSLSVVGARGGTVAAGRK